MQQRVLPFLNLTLEQHLNITRGTDRSSHEDGMLHSLDSALVIVTQRMPAQKADDTHGKQQKTGKNGKPSADPQVRNTYHVSSYL